MQLSSVINKSSDSIVAKQERQENISIKSTN